MNDSFIPHKTTTSFECDAVLVPPPPRHRDWLPATTGFRFNHGTALGWVQTIERYYGDMDHGEARAALPLLWERSRVRIYRGRGGPVPILITKGITGVEIMNVVTQRLGRVLDRRYDKTKEGTVKHPNELRLMRMQERAMHKGLEVTIENEAFVVRSTAGSTLGRVRFDGVIELESPSFAHEVNSIAKVKS